MWFKSTDLESERLGSAFGQQRSWTNFNANSTSDRNGVGVVNSSLSSIRRVDGNQQIQVIRTSTDVRTFHLDDVTGEYEAGSFISDQLLIGTDEYTYVDTLGNQITFFGFDASIPAKQQGQFKSAVDAGGNLTYVSSWTVDGDIQEIRRQDAGSVDVESWLYTYYGTGHAHEGMVQTVQLRRPDGLGGWEVVRQVEYTYYTSGEANGAKGDLKTADIQDASGNSIETKHYRYYKVAEENGYNHGLKYAFDAASFARLAAAVADPFTATDAEIAPYAMHYFEYDDNRRVTRHDIQGFGGEAAVVRNRAPRIANLARQQRFNPLPLSIGEFMSMSHHGLPWPKSKISTKSTPSMNVRSSQDFKPKALGIKRGASPLRLKSVA